jgi:hypothetical protein
MYVTEQACRTTLDCNLCAHVRPEVALVCADPTIRIAHLRVVHTIDVPRLRLEVKLADVEGAGTIESARARVANFRCRIEAGFIGRPVGEGATDPRLPAERPEGLNIVVFGTVGMSEKIWTIRCAWLQGPFVPGLKAGTFQQCRVIAARPAWPQSSLIAATPAYRPLN